MKPSLKNIFLDGMRWADKLSARSRYAITFGLLVFLIGVWIIAYYLPVEKKHNLLTSEHITLQTEQLKAAQAKKECGQLAETCEYLEQQIQTYLTPTKHSAAINAAYIFEEAKKHNVALLSFAQAKTVKKPWYQKNGMDCILQGALKNITDFLSSIKTSEKMISCSKIKLELVAKNEFKASCTFFGTIFNQTIIK